MFAAIVLVLSFAYAPVVAASSPSAKDREFVEKAAVAGQFEVRASELAMTRASDPAIRAFAEMMVRDHTALAQKLKSLATSKRIPVPTALDAEHAQKLETLRSAASPKAFDEAYADAMEDGHDRSVSLFEKAAEDAGDADLRAFAKSSVATLRQHSEAAEKLDARDVAP